MLQQFYGFFSFPYTSQPTYCYTRSPTINKLFKRFSRDITNKEFTTPPNDKSIQPINKDVPPEEPKNSVDIYTSPILPETEKSSVKAIQYENYANEINQLSPDDIYDGFRLDVVKNVNRYMQANHTLCLGTSLRNTGYLYQFGPTFSSIDNSTILMARYGNDGTLNARALQKIGNNIETRVTASSSLSDENNNMVEFAIDTLNADWGLSSKLAWQGTWIANLGFSQLVHPSLHLGGDMTWIPASGASLASIGMRYIIGPHIITSTLGRQPNFKSPTHLIENIHTWKLQYYRKVSERLHLGTEIEIAKEPNKQSSTFKILYEYLFRQARIRASADAGGQISMTAQNASGFGISALVDFWKQDYKFGFMMQIAPPVNTPPESAT